MKYSELKPQHLLFVLSISLIAILQLSCAEQQTPAAQGRQALEEAAQAMGGLEALGAIENITRMGTRQKSTFLHGRRHDERLYVQPTGPFNKLIDFTVPRELAFRDKGRVIHMMDSVKGGYRYMGPALILQDSAQLADYRAEWDRDIVKFLVHALGEESTIEGITESVLEGQPHRVVSVRYIDDAVYKVFVEDSSHLISKLEFTEAHDRFGDWVRERIFSDYREVGDLKLPFSLVHKDMGLVTRVWKRSEISVNDELQEDRFEIPEAIREKAQLLARSEPVQVIPVELAKGVYFGEAKGLNTMWVEFEDFVVVVEAPNNELQSLETMRRIRETAGEKPIRYVVTTHHHEDHNGGIRTYVAEGVTLITQAMSEPAIRETLAYPFTLKPDRLAQSPQEPKIELVTDRRTITDGTRNLEVVHVPNPHADTNLVAYLPREGLVFQSDMFTIHRDETRAPRAGAEAKVLYDTVTREGWRVNQIVPGHGRLVEWSELVVALEPSD